MSGRAQVSRMLPGPDSTMHYSTGLCIFANSNPVRRSRDFQVGLPGFDRDPDIGIGIRSPQFTAFETNRIKPMRILRALARIAVGKDVTSDNTHDLTGVPPDVAWQSCVSFWMDVPRANSVANLEFRRSRRGALVRRAATDHVRHLRRRHGLLCLFDRFTRP